jgi:hypothetical protein
MRLLTRGMRSRPRYSLSSIATFFRRRGIKAERTMRRNDIVYRVNQLILHVSRTVPFRSDLDRHSIRAAMIFTFFAFSIQKWNQRRYSMTISPFHHVGGTVFSFGGS